jgi:hypothetical protein
MIRYQIELAQCMKGQNNGMNKPEMEQLIDEAGL